MAVDVVVVVCDDWEGIYLNGELAREGHSLPLVMVGNLLVGKTMSSFRSFYLEYDEHAKVEPYWSNLPPNLDVLRPFLKDN